MLNICVGKRHEINRVASEDSAVGVERSHTSRDLTDLLLNFNFIYRSSKQKVMVFFPQRRTSFQTKSLAVPVVN